MRDEILSEPKTREANGGLTAQTNPLSEREMDVAELLATGASNSEIAEKLVISPHTVKVHLRNIYEKLQVNSRTEAMTLLLKQGWVLLPGVEVPATEESAPRLPAPPEPLPSGLGPALTWQPVYLLAALLLSVVLVFWPAFVQSSPGATANLLTDARTASQSQPVVDALPRWTSRTPMTSPRSRFVAINHADAQIFVIGGEGAQTALLDQVEAYDLAVNEWRDATPLPVPLSNMAAALADGAIYIAGGTTYAPGSEDLQVSNRLWRYIIAEDRWQVAGDLPRPLAGASLVSLGGHLYLLGGWDGATMRRELWRTPLPDGENFLSGEGWQSLPPMPAAYAFAGAVGLDNRIYVAGGYDGQRELDTVQVYRVDEERWEALASLSTPRGGLSLLHDGLAIFAVGGGWTQAVNTIERFDPEANLWSNSPAPIAGEWRNLGAAASIRGYLYLLGGWSDNRLTNHFQYQSSFRSFLPATQSSEAPESPRE